MTHTRIALNFFGEGREPIVPPPAPCNVAYFELGKERLLLQRASVPNVLRRLHPVRLDRPQPGGRLDEREEMQERSSPRKFVPTGDRWLRQGQTRGLMTVVFPLQQAPYQNRVHGKTPSNSRGHGPNPDLFQGFPFHGSPAAQAPCPKYLPPQQPPAHIQRAGTFAVSVDSSKSKLRTRQNIKTRTALLLRQRVLERLVHVRLNPRLHLVFLRTVARRDPQRLLEVGTNSLYKMMNGRLADKRGRRAGIRREIETVRTSAEKDSRGAASTALIVSLLFGCTVAKPPETSFATRKAEKDGSGGYSDVQEGEGVRTKVTG